MVGEPARAVKHLSTAVGSDSRPEQEAIDSVAACVGEAGHHRVWDVEVASEHVRLPSCPAQHRGPSRFEVGPSERVGPNLGVNVGDPHRAGAAD